MEDLMQITETEFNAMTNEEKKAVVAERVQQLMKMDAEISNRADALTTLAMRFSEMRMTDAVVDVVDYALRISDNIEQRLALMFLKHLALHHSSHMNEVLGIAYDTDRYSKAVVKE